MREARVTVGEACTRDVVICLAQDTLVDAARQMRARRIGNVVVVEEHGGHRRAVGILTDRDLVTRSLAVEPDALESQRVGDAMSQRPVTITEDASLSDALQKMRAHAIRRLPVAGAEGELVGIIAFDDVLDLLTPDLIGLARDVARVQKRDRLAHV